MAGGRGLEEVRGEAWAEFDGDRQCVQTAVCAARPAPAHTDVASGGVGAGAGEGGAVQPGGGPGATHSRPRAPAGQPRGHPGLHQPEPAALGGQQIVTQRLLVLAQDGENVPPGVVQDPVHTGAAAVPHWARVSPDHYRK